MPRARMQTSSGGTQLVSMKPWVPAPAKYRPAAFYPSPEGLKAGDQKVKVILSYLASLRIVLYTEDLVSKKKQTNK